VIFITIAMVMLLREFNSLVQIKANLCHMLSGKAGFEVEIVDTSATGRCVKSLIFALNTFRIFVQFLFVVIIIIIIIIMFLKG